MNGIVKNGVFHRLVEYDSRQDVIGCDICSLWIECSEMFRQFEAGEYHGEEPICNSSFLFNQEHKDDYEFVFQISNI